MSIEHFTEKSSLYWKTLALFDVITKGFPFDNATINFLRDS